MQKKEMLALRFNAWITLQMGDFLCLVTFALLH